MTPPSVYQRQAQQLPGPIDVLVRGSTGPRPARTTGAGPDTTGARLLSRLPLRRGKAALRAARAMLFTAPQPTGRYLQVYAPIGDVRRELGKQSWAPNWEYSYHKRGEDLNLARVVWNQPDGLDVVWWQTHARGWGDGGRCYLRAHWEPEATEYPVEHLLERGLDFTRGMDNLRAALDGAGVEYDTVRRNADGGWSPA